MAGPYLWLRGELGPAIKGAWGATVGDLGVIWLPGTRLWLGGVPSLIGRVSESGLSRAWVVFEPPPPPATERVGPGFGI